MRRPATSFVHRAALVSAVVTGLLALTSPSGSGATQSAPADHTTDQTAHAHATTTTSLPAPASNDVTRSAHIGYLSCPAPTVLLTVTIQARAFAPGQLVTYRVSLHNPSRATCGTPGRTFPTSQTMPNFVAGLLGACGELSVAIYDAKGTNVYPGPVAYGCPMIVGPSIAPGLTIATTGTWQPAGSRGAGRYRLVIDGKVTLPIVITGTTPQGFSGLGSPPISSTRVPPPSALPRPTVPFRLRIPGPRNGSAPPALSPRPPPTSPRS